MFGKLIMNLVPQWALEHKEFWDAIRTRILWFIRLRYGVVILLLAFIILSISLFKIEFTPVQLTLILIITVSIFVYNLVLHYLRRFVKFDSESFNPLSLSLLQMLLDLLSLSLLVYYTGGIESPLYMLFVFHMIARRCCLHDCYNFCFDFCNTDYTGTHWSFNASSRKGITRFSPL